ncbi:MAG: SprT family zinc-dependent metalloprotease [Burkholderiales bacterium]
MRRLLQLALDRLEPASTLAPATVLPAHPPEAGPAPKSTMSVRPAGSAESPGKYRHPRADREALLVGTVVGYQLKRARRRTIGFSIRDDGLVVTAPGWVPEGQIQSALHDKADWIVRKLGESQLRAERAERQRIVWQDGAQVPYLGGLLTVRIDAVKCLSAGAAALDPQDGTMVLRIGLTGDASPERVRDLVQTFLQSQAECVFEARLRHFAPQVGVQWRRLALSDAATRWGSANSNGSIRLHWRLIQLAPALLDYVVVHELAHLKHMDHSPRFWALVRSVVPDCVALRRQLQAQTLAPWS